jgi:hypothetical protein
MVSKPYLKMYKATGWSGCEERKATTRQPHLFYSVGEVDALIDEIKDQHKFELRKRDALEAFYLKELKR